jgi:hypothetical protein
MPRFCVAGLALVLVGCTAEKSPTDSHHLFAQHIPAFKETQSAGLQGSSLRLLKGGSVDMRASDFHLTVPKSKGGYVLVAVCNRGRISVGSATQACNGRLTPIVGVGADYPGEELDMSVSEVQLAPWGAAVYVAEAG